MRLSLLIAATIVLLLGVLVYLQFFHGTGEDGAPVLRPAVTTPAPADDADGKPKLPANLTPPTFDVVRIGRDGSGVIAGRSAPEATVQVLSDGTLVGENPANREGEWVVILEIPLRPGSQKLSLRSTMDGIVFVDSDDIVVVAVPERPAQGFDESGDSGVVAVLTPRDGRGGSRVLQKPGSLKLRQDLSLESIDYRPDGTALFAGTAGPGETLRLYLDNQFLGSVTSDDAGRWSYDHQTPIAAGPHVFRVDQLLDGDNVELRIEQPFDPSMPLDTELSEGSVFVKPGNSLWQIARKLYGSGVLYTTIFRANTEQIRDPDLIYPGQEFALPSETAPAPAP